MPKESVSVRLTRRLRAYGLQLPLGTTLKRIDLTTEQREAGAWVWQAFTSKGEHLPFGSRWPMARLMESQTLVIDREASGIHVSPDTVPEKSK